MRYVNKTQGRRERKFLKRKCIARRHLAAAQVGREEATRYVRRNAYAAILKYFQTRREETEQLVPGVARD